VLVWSRHLHILYLSERRSSTHFTGIGMLTALNSSFPFSEKWFHQFGRELTDHPPRLVVLYTPEAPEYYSPEDTNSAVRMVRELITTKYVKAAAFGQFVIYGHLEQYPLSAISALAERAVAALVPKGVPDRGPF